MLSLWAFKAAFCDHGMNSTIQVCSIKGGIAPQTKK